MKRFSRLLFVVLIVAIVGGGGYWFYQNRLAPASASSASGTYRQIVQVKQGSLSSTVSVVGELDAVQSETLAFTYMDGTAKLTKLNVAAGNTVKKGQVLASIDPASYQQALDQAKSTLQADAKTLADLKAPPTELEIATDDLAIAQGNYDLAKAKQDLADFQSPDLASLKTALLDAQDSLQQAELDQTLAERDSLAKSERDISYSSDWNERRLRDLLALKRPEPGTSAQDHNTDGADGRVQDRPHPSPDRKAVGENVQRSRQDQSPGGDRGGAKGARYRAGRRRRAGCGQGPVGNADRPSRHREGQR